MKKPVKMEFHVSRSARTRYHFDESLFSITGNIIFINLRAARSFVQKINKQRSLSQYPDDTVKPGQLIAMGLIDEIMHFVIGEYRKTVNVQIAGQALEYLREKLGHEAMEEGLRVFAEEYPPIAVHRGEISPAAYLDGTTEGIPNREIILEEALTVWLANMNPAFGPFKELFDDTHLKENSHYLGMVHWLYVFFSRQPVFGPFGQNLIDMLRSPAIAEPHSLTGQIEYIRKNWLFVLKTFGKQILRGLDVFKEEENTAFMGQAGPGPSQVYRFQGLGYDQESERFSPDLDWMPRLVLMAKNIFVWLDQLSKKHGRRISHLSDIPDEELDMLAQSGFTGLWLIGVWERSTASEKIKQYCGNLDAVASAYSLYDYIIAAELGGESAYEDLKQRAWSRGIRLASDMVPNHVGIISRWVIEHPDWFVSLDHNPYPWYTFTGGNLSDDDRVAVHIEDHYYERTDAAVVFKRVDRQTGQERYVYHGNDGTSMPWNDTAQLNYLNPAVREAVIGLILDVARRFPVIRFDAAMTLTKRHYQRLWFPEPGSGGAIPTRSEFGLSKEEFNRAMPNEFWREVVDRVAAEAPDTLLLAEAFWLLEGYFVRTLGMHRVYNSAFMNMLRDEENAKYRMVLKNTLEFDPEVLRRFVNFMNNPDERTAVDQFGKDDKYFGVCVLMITMPGLPMFGHGQLEGYTEKYGMEYKRAYYDETPDAHLMDRHRREIFPLLHKRPLFAGVDNFLLYDFYTRDGVNEDVFVCSNRHNGESALIVYHNRFADTRGWIRTSVAYASKGTTGGTKNLVRKDCYTGLGLHGGEGHFVFFRDHTGGTWYVRRSAEIAKKGLYIEIGAYKNHVFLDFTEKEDNRWQHFSCLERILKGSGTGDLTESLRDSSRKSIREHFADTINAGIIGELSRIVAAVPRGGEPALPAHLTESIDGKTLYVLEEMKHHTGGTGNPQAIARSIIDTIGTICSCAVPEKTGKEGNCPTSPEKMNISKLFISSTEKTGVFTPVLMLWGTCAPMKGIIGESLDAPIAFLDLAAECDLIRSVVKTIKTLDGEDAHLSRAHDLFLFLVRSTGWPRAIPEITAPALMEYILSDPSAERFMGVHAHKGARWIHKESFEVLLAALVITGVVSMKTLPSFRHEKLEQFEKTALIVFQELISLAETCGYRLDTMLQSLRQED